MTKLSPEQLKELFESIGKGASVAQVADAIFPVLEEMKKRTFRELAYETDSLKLVRVSGKAELLEDLVSTLQSMIDEGKAASQKIQETK